MSRILAIDYGTKRIGLAISDRDRRIASPLEMYERKDAAQDARYFQRVVTEEKVELLVLGLPVHTTGTEGQKARETRAFGDWLKQTTGLPLVHRDERFTTVEAESLLWDAGLSHKQRKQRRDMLAAQILLQSYLDAGCPPEEEIKSMDER
jgi:putative Holliday junction resolvase